MEMECLGKGYNGKLRTTMKRIKSFRISEENIEKIKGLSEKHDRSEGYIVNRAIEKYMFDECGDKFVGIKWVKKKDLDKYWKPPPTSSPIT